MTKVEVFSSTEEKIVPSFDFEKIEVVWERNMLSYFVSLTYKFGFELEEKLTRILESKYKEQNYKILLLETNR